ncbi:acetate--CoA ligase family protein [Polaromonas sp. AET17H-212]|uniref:acetate--CoA ligase family protein n=1 Tax=Polaromonas sp. AET17H-212 TaxID=1977061 RepID=UPI0020D128B7|nr:acetate--CoA ligase family protein [Polaromonas sp. AET17H-212]
MFAPKSVAVVGVSPTAGAFGSRTLAILEQAKFAGPIYPVNAKYDRIGERQCYPSIKALPETPDCVIIAVPREAVEPIVVECAERRVGGIIIYSSGYSETGKSDREKQQARLVQISRESGVRILGPNCIGALNYKNGFHATFAAVPDASLPTSRPDAIGLVSQSGALGFALSQAIEHGISFSHVLACGNACDVDVADEISYLADDPNCKVIACVFEGMSNPSRIIEAAEIAHVANKPVIIYKMATGEQGAAAAMSHTGSLAGSNAAYRAAFKRVGIIVVDNFEALIETAAFFGKASRPKAPGVAVVATSGGACIMAADKAELYNVQLPQPVAKTREVLERVVPEFGSPKNPCDVTAQVLGSPESLHACVDALMSDDTFGALVVPQPLAYAIATARLKIFSESAKRYNKIACAVWLTEWMEGPGAIETELDPHVAMFRSMDRCFATLAAWNEREQWMRAQPRKLARASGTEAAQTAAKLLDSAENNILTEREAKKVLSAYGIPVVDEELVQSADDAVTAANGMGYPVAMKVESPDLPHKTEAGVIRLNLKTEAEVRSAYEAVMANAKGVSPPPKINGVLVQPMIPAGTEIMVGAKVDPLFGPLIVVGLGGILVELLKDTVLDLAPVNHDEALAMLGRLKGKAVLAGFRGSEPVNLDNLANIVCRLSELVADQKERISELDVNPLICSGERIIAVDALIVTQHS